MGPRGSQRLALLALAFRYLAVAALVVLAAVAFGWRVPAAVAVVVAALALRSRVDRRWPKGLTPSKLFVTSDLLVSGIVGATVGGVLFGGAVVIVGFAMGVAFSLGSIPLSTKNAEGVRVPLSLQSSPATAKGLTIFGFLLPVVLLGVCVLVLLSH